MTIDDKTIKDMEETRDKTIEIIVLMQIAMMLEGIFSSIIGVIVFCASYLFFHFTNAQLITEFEIFIGIVIGMMGITGLIGIIKQRLMFKEYDDKDAQRSRS